MSKQQDVKATVAELRKAAQTLLDQIEGTSDPELKRLLAAKAFELLRQAAHLSQGEMEVRDAPAPLILKPSKAPR